MTATSARRIAQSPPAFPGCRGRILLRRQRRSGLWQCGRQRVDGDTLSVPGFCRPMPAACPAAVGKSARRWRKRRSRSSRPVSRPTSWAWRTIPVPPAADFRRRPSTRRPPAWSARGTRLNSGRVWARVEPEAELTIVIASRARGLTPGNAMGAVLGYTIGNDVSARNLQESDELWISAKSQDTFTPVGPWIVTDLTVTTWRSASNTTVGTPGGQLRRPWLEGGGNPHLCHLLHDSSPG